VHSKTAFIDEQLLAGDFSTGDLVRKVGLHAFSISPYVGRVIYSNVDTGKIHVQWPWGAEQESPVELMRLVDPEVLPPTFDQSFKTWESEHHKDGKEVEKLDQKFRKSIASRIVDAYETKTLPLYHAACEAWHCQMPEIETYVRMASVFGDDFGDEAIRLTVSNLYESGRRLAIYWKDKKRRYKTTRKERELKCFSCPRCKSILRPRTYRQGRRVLMCKTCSFAIAPSDIIFK